ncbi:MAG: cytochrome c [Desulfitobacterium sp.]|nr:cytochrome c [Desulfitobacterium sp.]
MRFHTFAILSALSFAIFSIVVIFSWRLDKTISEEVVAGKIVWQQYNCVSCHTIFGHGGYVGKDLTSIASEMTIKEMEEFFSSPSLIPPHKKVFHQSLRKREVEAIYSYFEFLSTIPTLGWPPVPVEIEGEDKP